jgi:hypothetical protein
MELMNDIITILVGGITQVGTAIGQGLSSLVTSIFTVAGTGGTLELSTFGTVIVVFAGISLALSLCYLIVHWISSLGAGSRM